MPLTSVDPTRVAERRRMRITATFLSTLAILFAIIGLSSLGWIRGTSGTGGITETVHVGINKMQVSGGGIDIEQDVAGTNKHAGQLALGCGVTAILCGLFGLIVAVTKYFGVDVPFYRVAVLFGCFVAGLLFILGTILYATKCNTTDILEDPTRLDKMTGSLNFSFALYLIAGVFDVVAGVILVYVYHRDAVMTSGTVTRESSVV